MRDLSRGSTHGRGERGQALLEFGITLPLILLVTMAIFDFGRALFVYTHASNQLREALRYGAITGYNLGTPQYLDCDGMRDIAQNVMFQTDPPEVRIDYIRGDGTNTTYPDDADDNCVTGEVAESTVHNGDMLRIRVTADIQMITPILPLRDGILTLTLEGRRTIVKNVNIEGVLFCGDEVCRFDLGETWRNCPFDCDPVCDNNEPHELYDLQVGVCDPEWEDTDACLALGIINGECACNENYICDPAETLIGCPEDCRCDGDAVCDIFSDPTQPDETDAACMSLDPPAYDCTTGAPLCGDGACTDFELDNASTCPQDCAQDSVNIGGADTPQNFTLYPEDTADPVTTDAGSYVLTDCISTSGIYFVGLHWDPVIDAEGYYLYADSSAPTSVDGGWSLVGAFPKEQTFCGGGKTSPYTCFNLITDAVAGTTTFDTKFMVHNSNRDWWFRLVPIYYYHHFGVNSIWPATGADTFYPGTLNPAGEIISATVGLDCSQ